jgi:hypothetical protein
LLNERETSKENISGKKLINLLP